MESETWQHWNLVIDHSSISQFLWHSSPLSSVTNLNQQLMGSKSGPLGVLGFLNLAENHHIF